MEQYRTGDVVCTTCNIISENVGGAKDIRKVNAEVGSKLYVVGVSDKAPYPYKVSKTPQGTDPFWVCACEIRKVN